MIADKRIVLYLVATLAITSAWAVELHVSPSGNDNDIGSKDKPLRSFAAAQKAVRKLIAKSGDGRPEPHTVWVHKGTYYLPETVVFTAEDSGSSNALINYAAVPGEKVVLSAGRQLNLDWCTYKNGIMLAAVPAGFVTDQLFVNGQRQNMARYPNYDAKVMPYHGYAEDCIDPERVKRWTNPVGGFVHGLQKARWGGYSYIITGVNDKGEVQLKGGYQHNRCPLTRYGYFCNCMLDLKGGWKPEYLIALHKQYRFVENIFEELDAPGEWFLDSKAGMLYFYPPAGVDMSKAMVEVGGMDQAVVVRGTQQQPVRFLRFVNLEFRHTARTFMKTTEPVMRSDWRINREAALFLEGAEDIRIDGCVFRQLGGNAVFLSGFNRRITVTGCLMDDVGASCVAIIGRQDALRRDYAVGGITAANVDKTPGPKSDNYPGDCLIEQCLMHDFGLYEKQVAGVTIDLAARITVRHCSIYNCPRAGINIGDGCWGGHVIENCDVFNTVMESNDHGAFNSWGRDRFWRLKDATPQQKFDWARLDVIEPIIIRNSRWRCDSGWDIDLDDASTNYQIYNNVMLAGGLKFGMDGYLRTAYNNILINDVFHAHKWPQYSHSSFSNNIVTGSDASVKVGGLAKGIDFNLVRDAETLTRLQAQGSDTKSLAGDPKFMDPLRGDYRVSEDSPALKIGFKNFPMDQFGVTLPRLQALAAKPEFPPRLGSDKPKSQAVTLDWLGAKIKTLSGLEEQSATGMDEQRGAYLVNVPKGSAAASVGLKGGDVILAVDGKPVKTADDLLTLLKASVEPLVKLSVWREQKDVLVELPSKVSPILAT